MEKTFTREEIRDALDQLRDIAYDGYAELSELAKQARAEGRKKTAKGLRRWANDLSIFMDGIKAAAACFNVELGGDGEMEGSDNA